MLNFKQAVPYTATGTVQRTFKDTCAGPTAGCADPLAISLHPAACPDPCLLLTLGFTLLPCAGHVVIAADSVKNITASIFDTIIRVCSGELEEQATPPTTQQLRQAQQRGAITFENPPAAGTGAWAIILTLYRVSRRAAGSTACGVLFCEGQPGAGRR